MPEELKPSPRDLGLEQKETKSEEQETQIEQEAAEKIRNFVDDPKLKFHFAQNRKIGEILDQGIISWEFAKKIGKELSENMSVRAGGTATENRSVSIVDREKNPDEGEDKDWFIKFFSEDDEYIGFLLPNDLKVREKTPHPNESLAPIRVKPEKIEGLFITERDTLFETLAERERKYLEKYAYTGGGGFSYSMKALCDFFARDFAEIISLDPELIKLSAEESKIWQQIPPATGWDKWPESLQQRYAELQKIKSRKLEGIAQLELEKIIGKPATEITEKDILVYFSKKKRIPLYTVSPDFKSQKVIWPKQPAT